jgi:serine protease Do
MKPYLLSKSMTALILIAGAWIAGSLLSSGSRAQGPVNAQRPGQDIPAAATASTQVNLRRTVTVEVAEKTKDAVVYISTTKVVNQRVSPFANDPFWNQFDLGYRKVPVGSLGSGFIIHKDGYVVTNHHVIDRARQIQVELLDGRKLQADLIASDPEADLAVLRIRSDKPFPTIELGDSSDLMVGEPVIAVGNPLGFSHSVSEGIVSALHRDLKADNNQVLLTDLIQTDAAINPGNSGGPLLNAYGQVIGISTAIRSDAQNIGFAIQVNKLRDLIPELMNPAQAIKVNVPIKMREVRKLTPPATVTPQIVNVDGDRVITSIAGERPRDIVDAYAILLRQSANSDVPIAYDDGKTQSIKATAAPLPDAIVQARKKLGLTLEPVTPMLAEKYGLAEERGLFVSQVARDSVASQAGLRPGDVIVQIGSYWVFDLDRFAALLPHMPNSGKVRVGILRGNEFGYGYFELGT